ncbi:MAG: hypothetical protein IT174_11445 [Acidobacteria bacterium]|nr:hypothetical protein [Acidobacteriota bacterium]
MYSAQKFGIAILGVVILAVLASILTRPAMIKSDPNYTPVNQPMSQAGPGLDPLANDASAWNVSEPDLTSLGASYKKQWEAGLGDQVLMNERRVVQIKEGAPGPHGIRPEFQVDPEIWTNCGGRIDNFRPIGRKFYKQGGHVIATITYEGDVYGKKAISKKVCGEYVSAGRRSTEVHYVWTTGSTGRNEWIAQNEALADPKFKNSILKPDTQAGIEENKKFEAGLRSEQKEREDRHERYRALRANRSAAR